MVLFLAFAAPFYYNARKSKKNREFQVQVFQQNALEKRLNIVNQDSWRERYFIGLDSAKRKVLYIHFQEVPTIIEIDLSKVISIELHEKSHEVGSGNGKRKITDNLDLIFHFKNKESSESLEFYDGEKYSDMEGEIPLTRTWCSLLKANLIVKSNELIHSKKSQRGLSLHSPG
jgi:hypothetical protein